MKLLFFGINIFNIKFYKHFIPQTWLHHHLGHPHKVLLVPIQLDLISEKIFLFIIYKNGIEYFLVQIFEIQLFVPLQKEFFQHIPKFSHMQFVYLKQKNGMMNKRKEYLMNQNNLNIIQMSQLNFLFMVKHKGSSHSKKK